MRNTRVVFLFNKLMKYFNILFILFFILLSACASVPTEAQTTTIARGVQFTLQAEPTHTESPTATEKTENSTPSENFVDAATATSADLAVIATPTLPPLPAPTEPAPAQIVEPTETPYVVPGWPLFRRGDAGPEVYAIQHLLRSHGYNLAVDGIFGLETRQQVLNFQLAKGLSTDGIVGPQTWAALIQGKTVAVGSTGQPVRAVQRLLRDRLGYIEVVVDGDFGPITDNVIVAIQNAYDLTPDGIVGPQTWRALVAASPLAQ